MTAVDADAEQFGQLVAQLREAGLNASSLGQILKAGPADGMPVAQGIASGGEKAVGKINALERQIRSAAAALRDCRR